MNNEMQLEQYNTMPVSRAVLRNVIPSMIAMLMILIYNLADTFFVGQTHDALQVAAVSLVSPIFMLYTAVGNIFGMGGTSVISRFLGEKNIKKAASACSFCMWASIGIGIVMSVAILIFMEPLLYAIGAGPSTYAMAKEYVGIIVLAGPFQLIAAAFSNILRAEGQSTKAMIGTVSGNIVNIILDPIFILILGMNVKGAAIATALGNLIGGGYYILYYVRGKSSLSIHPQKISFQEHIVSGIFAIGIPASFSTLLMSISHMIINALISGYGDMALAGIGVALKVAMIVGTLCIGLGQGVQPLLGYCVGSGNKKRYKKIMRYSLVLGLGLGSFMTLLCYILIRPITNAFLTDPDAFSYGVTFTQILIATGFLLGIFYVLNNALQALGAAKEALIVNISRQGIIYIPLMLIMGFVWGIYGILWAQPVADIITIILAFVLYRKSEKAFIQERTKAPILEEPVHLVSEKQEKNANYPIIVIGRSYGAGGRSIGKAVAETLGIPFYDKELLSAVAEETGLSQQYLSTVDEKESVNYIDHTLYTCESTATIARNAQADVIRQISANGSCVIVGRRADKILQGITPIFSVFISAPLESRIVRVMKRERMTEELAREKVLKVDRERSEYYNYLSDTSWGYAESYDLCIDTHQIGINGAVQIIVNEIRNIANT